MTERHEAVRYFVEQDMMAIEIRPWPGKPGEHGEGYDAGPDLVIHVYPGDGAAWLWEIENASQHPEHIATALTELRRRYPAAAAAQRDLDDDEARATGRRFSPRGNIP
jgi:hypothetical protein